MAIETFLGRKYTVVNGTGGADQSRGGRDNEWFRTGAGNDRIKDLAGSNVFDAGAGSDVVVGGVRDDIFIHRLGENRGAFDRYEGGMGSDTLRLELTAAEWARADVKNDVQAFLAHVASKRNVELAKLGLTTDFSFKSMGLRISNIEKISLIVDGVELNPVTGRALAADAKPANTAPTAVADVAATDAGKAVTVNVLANDTDAEKDALTISSVTVPTGKGTAQIVNGQVVYDPGQAFAGLAAGAKETVVLTYKVKDAGGLESTSTATVTITGTKPGNTAPTAVADVAATDAGKAVTVNVLANDTDAEKDALTISSVTVPTGKGTAQIVNGQVVYDPGQAFAGLAAGAKETVVLTYKVKDAGGLESTSTATVTITGTKPGNTAPTAVADVAATDAGKAVTVNVLANDTDAEKDALTISSVTVPTGKGTAQIVNGQVVYDPGQAFAGLAAGAKETVVLTYKVKDAGGLESTSTATVTITGTKPGNTAPTAVADVAATDAGKAVTVNVLANDTDAEKDALTISSVTVPTGKGTAQIVNGQVVYDPGQAFAGLAAGAKETVVLTYKVKDAPGLESTSTATVTITGTKPGNTAPTAVADVAATDAGKAVTVNVLANDTDAEKDALTISSVTVPTGKGTAQIVNGQVVYDPGQAFAGLAAGAEENVVLTYKVKDAPGLESTSTVTITVKGVAATNPGGDRFAIGTDEDTSVGFDPFAPVTGLGAGLAVDKINQPTKGTVALEQGSLVFTPGQAFQSLGRDQTEDMSFSYVVRDASGATSTVNVVVTVAGLAEQVFDRTNFAGDNVLVGSAGDDDIFGDLGNDTLTGNGGRDQFIFQAPGEGVDRIKDFVSGTDKIVLLADGFLVDPGTLPALVSGADVATATVPANSVFFDNAGANTGTLYWKGASGDAIALAILENVTSITQADIALL